MYEQVERAVVLAAVAWFGAQPHLSPAGPYPWFEELVGGGVLFGALAMFIAGVGAAWKRVRGGSYQVLIGLLSGAFVFLVAVAEFSFSFRIYMSG